MVLIAFGGATSSDGDEELTQEVMEEQRINLALALIGAIVSGFVLSLNTVSVQYCIHAGFELDQANYDGGAMVGFLQIPFLIAYREAFSLMDLLVGSTVVVLVQMGIICLSRGLECGIAGPVQAIENSKTVV